MNFKSFIRGFGVGIIFSCLIILAAYLNSGNSNLSDKDIIEKAKKLGLVEKESLLVNDKDIDNKTNEEKNEESDIDEENVIDLENTNDEPNNKPDEKAEDSDEVIKKINANIHISTNMSVDTISILLRDSGIVESDIELKEFLVNNGYENKIKKGEHTFTNELTFKEIAEELSK